MVKDQKGERCVKTGTDFSGQVSQNGQFRGNGSGLPGKIGRGERQRPYGSAVL